ncbi:hypothetical protein C4J92_2488 [Pseudomonas sp. R3-18-08]|nr:hypothetical protein C4J92_2488 [Pseudomonas sp. R3-18-08]
MVNIAASAQMMMLWDAERLWRRYHAERGNEHHGVLREMNFYSIY